MTFADRFPKVAPNSMTARVLLSFLATAGLFYVNIMPALVDGLKEGLAFTNKEAGMVGAFNMYGGACGALLMAFVIRRLPWRSTAQIMLAALIAADLVSMLATVPAVLMAVRFVHGFIGGALVGLGFSLFARMEAPDRTFGVLLLVQTFAGGLGVMCLPLLVPTFGMPVLFATLILFSLITMAMVLYLPDYPIVVPAVSAQPVKPLLLTPFLFALFSVFLFQAANMALYAFVIGLGKNAGLEIGFISESLGLANWVGSVGALLVVVLSTRHGIFKPIVGGMLLTLLGTWALFYCEAKWIWILANFIGGLTWNFVIAYLLGMCARFDRTGQTAVWAGFASKMGLASGPMLGAFIVGDTHYVRLIWMSLALMLVATVASAIPARRLDTQTEL